MKQQQKEALKRMRALKLLDEVITDFSHNGTIKYSENCNQCFNAVLYDCDEERSRIIKNIEHDKNILIYHAQLTHTVMGDWWTYLYVSAHPEEWDMDINDIQEGYPVAFCTSPLCPDGEFGSVQIKPSMGGIVRLQ